MIYQICGFGFWLSWLWVFFYGGPLLKIAAVNCNLTARILLLSYFGGLTIALALCGYKASRTNFKFDKPLILTGTLFLCLLPPLLLLPHTPVWTPPEFFLQPAVWLALLSGCAAAPLLLAWIMHLGQNSLGVAAISLTGSLCMPPFFTMLASHLPTKLDVLLMCCFPLLSFLCLRQKDKLQKNVPLGTSLICLKDYFSWRLILFLGLLYLANGTLFTVLNFSDDYAHYYYISNLGYVAACIWGAWQLETKPYDEKSFIFKLILPLLGISFLLIPFLPHAPIVLLTFILARIGTAFLDMYTWLLCAGLSRNREHPVQLCGYGLALKSSFLFLGRFLPMLVFPFLPQVAPFYTVTLIAGCACFMAAFFQPAFWPLPKEDTISLRTAVPLTEPPLATIAVPAEMQVQLPVNTVNDLSTITACEQEPKTPTVEELLFPEPEQKFPEPTAPDQTTTSLAASELKTQEVPSDETRKVESVSHFAKDVPFYYHIGKNHITLTPREREVLFFLKQGFSYARISEQLFISPNTVKFHVKNIYNKFGVSNRSHLLEMLWQEHKKHPSSPRS